MTTHLTADQMRNYLVRRISIDQLGEMSEHLHGCRTCYQAYLSVLQTRFPIEIDFDELAGLKGWHLEGEELASYLGGRMNQVDLDYARLHLQECSACAQRVYEGAENWPEVAPTTMGTNEEYEAPWREYFTAFHSITSPRWRVTAVLILVIGVALIFWAVLHRGSEKAQVAQDVPPETIPFRNVEEPATPSPPGPGVTGTERSIQNRVRPMISAAPPHPEGQDRQSTVEIETALIAKALTMPPDIEMLDRTPSISVRGNHASTQSFKIVRPFATVIDDDRPTFSWTGLDGATNYTVSIFDARLHLVRTSEPLTETRWRTPDRLKAGIVYTWAVTALKDGREIVAPAPPARAEFRLLEKSELTKLSGMVSMTESHAARGVLYARAGLLDKAEKEFQTHLVLLPDERVKRLLEIVKSWRDAESHKPPSPTTTKPAQ